MSVHTLPAPEAAHLPAVLDMLTSTSADRALCDATYLPFGMVPADATAWAATRPAAWVVFDDGAPVGW